MGVLFRDRLAAEVKRIKSDRQIAMNQARATYAQEMATLCEQFREKRVFHGILLTSAAKAAGITPNKVSHIESGRTPDVDVIANYVESLDVLIKKKYG